MPPRPALFLRPPQWTCRTCLRRTTARTARTPCLAPQRPHVAQFHSTPRRFADSTSTPNHYHVLQLTATASAAEIKRQFYALSKKHHPDRNQDDPTASTRFVAISEAYHVLSVPEKRAQYDATLQSATDRGWGSSSSPYPQGSYSSASFGARPASGLNKKRSTFRGPPPSFYKAGGYGAHGAKRAEYAHRDPQAEAEGKEAGQESYGEWGGFGPGQQKQGNEVPHFDDRRHKEMHDNVNEHIWARRRRTQRPVRADGEYDRGGMLMNFLLVSSVIAIIGMGVNIFGDHGEKEGERRRRSNGS